MSIDIVAKELSIDADGTVDIPMFAAASAPLPGPFDPPVTVAGTVTIAPHPIDGVGCTWTRTFTTTDFTMTVLPPAAGSIEVSLILEAPEWHYTVTCPTNPPTMFRMPAFGELQMGAYIGYTFPELGPPAGGPLEVPPVSRAPDCVMREATLHRTVELADVILHVVIYRPPCLF